MSAFSIRFRIVGAALSAALAMAASSAAIAKAEDACGLCAKEVVVNGATAACLLERYEELAARAGLAIPVNLEDCAVEDRGVVAALRGPQAGGEPPSLRFIVSAAQLTCIKAKLEDPAVVLDPSLTIDLAAC